MKDVALRGVGVQPLRAGGFALSFQFKSISMKWPANWNLFYYLWRVIIARRGWLPDPRRIFRPCRSTQKLSTDYPIETYLWKKSGPRKRDELCL